VAGRHPKMGVPNTPISTVGELDLGVFREVYFWVCTRNRGDFERNMPLRHPKKGSKCLTLADPGFGPKKAYFSLKSGILGQIWVRSPFLGVILGGL
jgi:hypothetical protein